MFPPTPNEQVTIGLIDVDAKGLTGGTQFWATVTHHFKVTTTREEFVKKMSEAYDIVQKQLVKS